MSSKKIKRKQSANLKRVGTGAVVARNSKNLIIILSIIFGVLLVGSGVVLAAVLMDGRSDKHNLHLLDGLHDENSQDDPAVDRGSGSIILHKPIIYLYPTHETEVSVRLSNPQNFTAQYPAYGNGWQVVAQPNGDLRDIKTGRELYSLYYESDSTVPATVKSDGFIVSGGEVARFLEGVLPKLGLNAHESNEFIIYWLPILQQNPYNYIRFETLEEMNVNQRLTVSPQPDTIIRVMMSYRPLQTIDELGEIHEQVIVTPERTGFVVVEWGGTNIGGKVMR